MRKEQKETFQVVPGFELIQELVGGWNIIWKSFYYAPGVARSFDVYQTELLDYQTELVVSTDGVRNVSSTLHTSGMITTTSHNRGRIKKSGSLQIIYFNIDDPKNRRARWQ